VSVEREVVERGSRAGAVCVAGSRYNKATLALAYSLDTSPKSNPTWIRVKRGKKMRLAFAAEGVLVGEK
jgi:hypothetical protein